MKRKTFFAVFLALLIIGTVIPVCSLAEEEIFTVTFTEGIKLINPLTGKKPTNIFTGTEVPPITVEAGGSFVFPENTVIFRDYVFDGWKYTYTDEDGKKQTEFYQPGDTYENVTSDMEFGVNWKRPDPIELVITGYLTFVNTESYVDGDLPETRSVVYNSTVKLEKSGLSKDGYKFAGWVDSDGSFYEDGGEYVVNKLNPVLTAVWTPDGSSVLTHKVTYAAGADDFAGELPRPLEMYRKNTFMPPECTLTRDGWKFVCWQDDDGNRYEPGEEYTVDVDSLELTAAWEKVTKYFNVDISVNNGGNVVPNSTQNVAEGSDLTLTATPFEGFYISSFVVNGVPQEIEDNRAEFEFELTSISGDVLVEVLFEEIKQLFYEVTLLPSDGGKLAKVDVLDGRIGFAVYPDEGYRLSSLSVTGATATEVDGVYMLSDFTDNVVVKATFTPVSSESSEAENSKPERSADNDKLYLILMGIVIVILVAFAVVYTKRMK